MSDYQKSVQEEAGYLKKTLDFLREEISRQTGLLSDRKSTLIAARKDMWENSTHYTKDFTRLTEANQYLAVLSSQTASCSGAASQIEKFRKMLKSPYFGRFDFVEEGSGEKEKIYIGLHNAMDPKTQDILVYDWRAPISSIFYRYELGKASYKAPYGIIGGEVMLKRQYKIKDSELEYFFDCNIKIDDEMLQEVLSHNASAKMRNIVETIQREQDIIIRDTDSELLIVQGVAGSGKTSIALHRVAYLLYHGLSSNIGSQNIMIVSPNAVFSKYISSVLPELGEENVNQITFDEFAADMLKEKGRVETRGMWLEALIGGGDSEEQELRKQNAGFKGSRVFVEILNRLIKYYERHKVAFEDVCYDGKVIETKHRLKSIFLDNKIKLSAANRLKRLENMILDKIKPVRKKRLEKIERLVQKTDGHEFEIKSFSRLLLMKESKAFLNRLRRFTEIDYLEVYNMLFREKGLLQKLGKGLVLPENLGQMATLTTENLERGFISYEDSAALLYLKLKLEDNDMFSDIRQVVIDEAQDYSPVQYEVYNLLFRNAGYTVMGDVNQSIDRDSNLSLYDSIVEIFGKRKSVKVTLNKSYRSSFEINDFNQGLLDKKQDIEAFERHEEKPALVYGQSHEDMEQRIAEDIEKYTGQGFESVAVICKTTSEAEKLYLKLKRRVDVKLIVSSDEEIEKGVVIIPAYMAKGLEFDAVLVYNVSEDSYYTGLDKKLLYIACTRALHRLALYYTGVKSSFFGAAR